MVHIGRVILVDKKIHTGRSRSRSRGRTTDWSRDKGKSDKELIEELRSKDRERAVCSSGKDYAKKPVGYKAACALPSEMGSAWARVMEEDTFVSRVQATSRRRSPSP